MKKFLMVLAVLALAVSANAQNFAWTQLGGWGTAPTAVDPSGAWIMDQTANNLAVNGTLYGNVAVQAGKSVTIDFDLTAINLPVGAGSEFQDTMWSEVYVEGATGAQNASYVNGKTFVDKMHAFGVYNAYSWLSTIPGHTGSVNTGWQFMSSWVNAPGHNEYWYGYAGNQANAATVNQTVHFKKTFATTGGNIFIALKTGATNTGTNNSIKDYGQQISNITISGAGAPVVPEPSSFLALGTGLMGMAGFVIRRRK